MNNRITHEDVERAREASELDYRCAQWVESRKKDAKRRDDFMATLKLPFHSKYGVHKIKNGDIFAIVVHRERHNDEAGFVVKFYTVRKVAGALYLFKSDADGKVDADTKGRSVKVPTIRGYKRVE